VRTQNFEKYNKLIFSKGTVSRVKKFFLKKSFKKQPALQISYISETYWILAIFKFNLIPPTETFIILSICDHSLPNLTTVLVVVVV